MNISRNEHPHNFSTSFFQEDVYCQLLFPETDLECKLLQDDDFREGLSWGQPRFGHPEGKVLYHIREVLDNIEKLSLSNKQREQLRLITFVHDTFKYKEDKNVPRDWSRHHGILARNFLTQYSDDTAVLDILEAHDEAYYSWRMIHIQNMREAGQIRLNNLLLKLNNNLQLFYLFFKIDTQTGDKTQAPIKWFERTIKDIEVVKF